jgi:hypothetical protein
MLRFEASLMHGGDCINRNKAKSDVRRGGDDAKASKHQGRQLQSEVG